MAIYTRQEAGPLRVFLAEDSTIMIGLLTTLIGGEPNLKVVGQAKSAGSAIEDINTLRQIGRAHV